MAHSTIKLASLSKIRRLYAQQYSGKSAAARTRARNQLKEIVNQQNRIANQRIKRLEKTDYAYGTSYDTIKQYLDQTGRKTLPQVKTDNKQPVTASQYEQALRSRRFLLSKESTISGQKEIERKRFETYRANYSFAKNMDDAQLREFLKFLGNSGADDYLAFYSESGSGDEVAELAEMFAHADETEKNKMFDLFREFEKWNEATEKLERGEIDEIPANYGKTYTELRKDLSALYEGIEKRRR